MAGAVITTSSLAVGSRCVFARAGVGVVLTQHWTDPRLGPRGLSMLAEGCPAAAVAAALAASTPQRAWRQLAVLDGAGGTGHFTGALTQPALAAASGADCVAVGNILRNATVPAAMVAAFVAGVGQGLADRLLAAVEAGRPLPTSPPPCPSSQAPFLGGRPCRSCPPGCSPGASVASLSSPPSPTTSRRGSVPIFRR